MTHVRFLISLPGMEKSDKLGEISDSGRDREIKREKGRKKEQLFAVAIDISFFPLSLRLLCHSQKNPPSAHSRVKHV